MGQWEEELEIRQTPAELAWLAFSKSLKLSQVWTDTPGLYILKMEQKKIPTALNREKISSPYFF
jgi:hypothetical protein